VEGSESATAALGRGVAHDDEIPGFVGADLLPEVGAAALVRGVGLLGDDALESHPTARSYSASPSFSKCSE